MPYHVNIAHSINSYIVNDGKSRKKANDSSFFLEKSFSVSYMYMVQSKWKKCLNYIDALRAGMENPEIG